MSLLNLDAGYFAMPDLVRMVEGWFNPCRHEAVAHLGGRAVRVRWTARADRELQAASSPLVVELQLYFSCVVKKRVLFHRHAAFEATRVAANLGLAFRPIASAACDPREFAAEYPPGRDLGQGAAARMLPRHVELDFRRGEWQGDFGY